MSGVNKVILIGNLGAKPELKYTTNGVPVIKLSVATTEYAGKDDSGNKIEHTEWHRVTAWRKLAEVCANYLDKGTKVYIEGKIRTNKWTDQNNIERYSTEIMMDNMLILTPKGTREQMHGYENKGESEDWGSSKTSFPSDKPTETINVDDDSEDDSFL